MPDPRLVRPLWRGRTNVDALTIACIEHAERLTRPLLGDRWHEFFITQGSYQGGDGDPLSQGTHDRGGVVDLRWCGHDECIQALRQAGMAAWHRRPSQGPWPDHIHAVVIGHPDLAPAAARQVQAYLAGRDGLKGDGPDDGPRFDPPPQPVWPPEEDDMFSDDDRALLKATNAAAVKAAEQAERARKGSYQRDRKLIELARSTSGDVDDILAELDDGA